MSLAAILSIVKERAKPVIAAGLLGGAIALASLMVGTYPFKARSDFLIIQSSVPYRELYSLSKSAEYVSNVLIDAAQSELFINEVLHDATIPLPAERNERLKRWRDIVSIKKNFRSNVLTVETKADTQDGAMRIAQAVAYVLTEKNYLFRTGGVESIVVRMLSGPIVEESPSLGTLFFVTVGGILAGMVIALAAIVIKSEVLRMLLMGQGIEPFPPITRV